jgi:hypothetical protein
VSKVFSYSVFITSIGIILQSGCGTSKDGQKPIAPQAAGNSSGQDNLRPELASPAERKKVDNRGQASAASNEKQGASEADEQSQREAALMKGIGKMSAVVLQHTYTDVEYAKTIESSGDTAYDWLKASLAAPKGSKISFMAVFKDKRQVDLEKDFGPHDGPKSEVFRHDYAMSMSAKFYKFGRIKIASLDHFGGGFAGGYGIMVDP